MSTEKHRGKTYALFICRCSPRFFNSFSLELLLLSLSLAPETVFPQNCRKQDKSDQKQAKQSILGVVAVSGDSTSLR